jgi:hypothetical protein
MAARMTEREYADFLRRTTRGPHFFVLGRQLCELEVIRESQVRDEDEQWDKVRCNRCLAFAPQRIQSSR